MLDIDSAKYAILTLINSKLTTQLLPSVDLILLSSL